jgi:hypothetical protein
VTGAHVDELLEEAFYRFCEYVGLGDPPVREDEWLTAQLRALALCPEPAFVVPAELRRAPRGWFAIAGDPPVLYAALAGRAIRGTITPSIAAVLRGEKAPDDALARELAAMGLL